MENFLSLEEDMNIQTHKIKGHYPGLFSYCCDKFHCQKQYREEMACVACTLQSVTMETQSRNMKAGTQSETIEKCRLLFCSLLISLFNNAFILNFNYLPILDVGLSQSHRT